MGVITLNVSIEVEQWYRGLPKGKRSKIVNECLANYIRARLGDRSANTVFHLSSAELVAEAIERIPDELYDVLDKQIIRMAKDHFLDVIEGKLMNHE